MYPSSGAVARAWLVYMVLVEISVQGGNTSVDYRSRPIVD